MALRSQFSAQDEMAFQSRLEKSPRAPRRRNSTISPPKGGGDIQNPSISMQEQLRSLGGRMGRASPSSSSSPTTPMVAGDRRGRRQENPSPGVSNPGGIPESRGGLSSLGPEFRLGGASQGSGQPPGMQSQLQSMMRKMGSGNMPGNMPVLKAQGALGDPGGAGVGQPGAEGAVGLENLGAVLERRLGTSTGGFGSAEAERFRKIAGAQREEERSAGVAGIESRAAKRGTFFSTIPSGAEGALETKLQRSADETDLQLQNLIAGASFKGQNRAIDDAFRFSQNAFQNEQQGASGLGNLGSLASQIGMQGGPSIDNAVNQFGMQPNAQGGGVNQDFMKVLGQLFGKAA